MLQGSFEPFPAGSPSKGAPAVAARKAILRKRKSKPAGYATSSLTLWPIRGLFANRMRRETRKKVREEHYPAPFRLIDLCERHG